MENYEGGIAGEKAMGQIEFWETSERLSTLRIAWLPGKRRGGRRQGVAITWKVHHLWECLAKTVTFPIPGK